MSRLSDSLPDPPYYAVLFTSQRPRPAGDDGDYAAVAAQMDDLARQQAGYLGMTSLRSVEGLGVTISYWADAASIERWRENAAHRVAQQRGRLEFYEEYRIEVCRVERATSFERSAPEAAGRAEARGKQEGE